MLFIKIFKFSYFKLRLNIPCLIFCNSVKVTLSGDFRHQRWPKIAAGGAANDQKPPLAASPMAPPTKLNFLPPTENWF